MNAPLKCDRLVRQRAHWRCTARRITRPVRHAHDARTLLMSASFHATQRP